GAVAGGGAWAAPGGVWRHRRPLYNAALTAADWAAWAAAAARGPGSAGAEQAAAVAQECAEAMIALHASLVRHHTPA
ncbi:MAG: hypothetical protein LBD51_04885, partial [Bifidobacteriaceae bacterium]|nr:hypothetical protein [Bifidobacteriaceae bacterium]